MATIRSFHSAPHSIVQSALAANLPGVAATAGIAVADQQMQQVTAILETVPHPRHGLERGAIATNPLGATSPFSSECIEMMVEYAWAAIQGNETKMREIASDFEKSSCDAVGWLGAAFHYLERELEFWVPITYHAAPAPPDDSYCYALPEQESFRIGILGDWGTGEPVAQDVVNAMLAQDVDFVIHVGDVYYAGTGGEVQSNYLDMIAYARAHAVPGETRNVPVYNIPGNHDYYFKGEPFYNALATVNAGAAFPNSPAAAVPTQQASFFALRNSWLQCQAMDTGYYDSDLFAVANDTTQLHDSERLWHLNQLGEAKANGRSVFLFSHHQPWSRFLGIGDGPGTAGGLTTGALPPISYNPNLQSQFATAPPDVVLAWFWGHEHVLEVYDQAAIAGSQVPVTFVPNQPGTLALSSLFPWVPYGACVGHSAFPMLDTDQPYKVASPLIQYNQTYTLGTTTSNGATVYDHGFTILDVSKGAGGKPNATATYYSLPADGSGGATPFSPASTIS